MPTPDVSNFVPQPAVPTNTCSGATDDFWLQYPDLWYGPFGNGDTLQFSSAGGFYVWDADYYGTPGLGATIPYPDPYLQWPRDQWLDLSGSIFSVCIDSIGNVFGRVR